MSFIITADTRLLQARLLDVSKGVKGGLRKAIGDSAARIGVQLARDTFPFNSKGTDARADSIVRRAYPRPYRVHNAIVESGLMCSGKPSGSKESDYDYSSRMLKIMLHKWINGELAEAVKILNCFAGFRARIAGSANESTLKTFKNESAGAGHVNKQGRALVFWNCIIIPEAHPSRTTLTRKIQGKRGSIANGWVVASRHFRAGRSTDYLPKLKTRKQKIVTGKGSWEGSADKPVAVLSNTHQAAFRAMRTGAMDRAITLETRNLEKQLVNQARFAARKARLGK